MSGSPAHRSVCFLTGTLNVMAGAERMTATIANALAQSGYEVSILSLWDRTSLFPLHPAIRHEALFDSRPSFKRAYLSTVSGIRKHVLGHGIDTVILVDTMLTLFTVPALFGSNVRQIAWEHCHFDEDLGRRARRFARRLSARACERIVVLTERDRARWHDALRPRSEVICIPNPLPFPMPDAPAARNGRTVLAVGRLTAAKGFDVLLNAWALVAGRAPGWNLSIIGEGEERPRLEMMRHELGLDGCVTLPGMQQNPAPAYANASVFCLSSRYEGFGLVLVEAMAFGLPIVSTDCETGPRELLTHGRNAIVVPAADPSTLAKGLLQIIQDRAEADRLAAAARDDARRYSLETIGPQWVRLLECLP